MTGQGKYDELCTHVREEACALAAMVIILGGTKGSGFSLQAHSATIGASVVRKLPELLREIADQIAADLEAEKKPASEEAGQVLEGSRGT